MAHIISGDDIYGPGTWIDSEALPVPDDARRLFKVLAEATPEFTNDLRCFRNAAQTACDRKLRDQGRWHLVSTAWVSGRRSGISETIGIDPSQECSSHDEAYQLIAEQVRKFGAHELEMMHLVQGLCGSICYTPAGWRQTRMSKDLSKHPLINYKLQAHVVPTPAIPLPVSAEKRPLAGIKVVELVRIIAGPVIGTTLAALVADVTRVNCGRLPDFNVSHDYPLNLATVLFTWWSLVSLQLTLNAGVRTIDVDLAKDDEVKHLLKLNKDADVFIQGYRPGVIARKGLSLDDLLGIAGKRGKGIVYVEENCYGPDGPMAERPGWQQIADAASGCSHVTGRSLGYKDGRCVLPALPAPDMLTGLVGAIGTMMAIRDRARQGGSYHVFASLMAAAALHLSLEVGPYSPEVVQGYNQKFGWDETGPELFVLELLDVVLKSWGRAMPKYSGEDSPYMSTLKGDWGEFQMLKPVIQLSDVNPSPYFSSAPEPNCYRSSGAIAWR
ncbi:unnamed protein product [Clonostachys rhizophaga]|uniref:Uncharacterized protein n=1 Tax=Clonostachys rhizophaga TaxID=160324 RepID=A0A9N9VPV6_9HYPO|nr:unnamed protein product [Clonostachys rhizophaga]